MRHNRFDNRDVLIEVIVELLNRGIRPEDVDLVLSRMGPVDLDLMQDCLAEVWAYNMRSDRAVAMAA